MFSPGIRNPRRSLLICMTVTLVSWAFVAWGAFEMHAAGQETLGSGLKIGLALLPGILGPLVVYNFWRGMKVFATIRRGENEVGRWTVTAADFAEFAASDKARNTRGGEYLNDWSPSREPPSSGIEVIFVADGVLVGDTYFTLSITGLFRFTGVRMLSESPPAIAFRTIMTWANRFSVRTTVGELRIPVSRLAGAEAAKVVAHFERVDARAVVVNPGFYRSRMRIGLIGAPIFFAVAAVGFVLRSIVGDDDSGFDPTLLIVIGLVLGIAMLILALAAKLLDRAQLRKR